MHVSRPFLLLPVALEKVELTGSPPGRGERCWEGRGKTTQSPPHLPCAALRTRVPQVTL